MSVRTVQHRQCTVERCGGSRTAKGYCQKHYIRWKKYGDPHFVKVTYSHDPAVQKDKRRAAAKRWRERYPEYIKRWQAKNPDKVRESQKRYYYRNKDRRDENARIWKQNNQDQVRHQFKKFDDLRYFGGNRDEVIRREGRKCALCRTDRKNRYIVHHIDERGRNVPAAKRNNRIENLIYLCQRCHNDVQASIIMLYWFSENRNFAFGALA